MIVKVMSNIISSHISLDRSWCIWLFWIELKHKWVSGPTRKKTLGLNPTLYASFSDKAMWVQKAWNYRLLFWCFLWFFFLFFVFSGAWRNRRKKKNWVWNEILLKFGWLEIIHFLDVNQFIFIAFWGIFSI